MYDTKAGIFECPLEFVLKAPGQLDPTLLPLDPPPFPPLGAMVVVGSGWGTLESRRAAQRDSNNCFREDDVAAASSQLYPATTVRYIYTLCCDALLPLRVFISRSCGDRIA